MGELRKQRCYTVAAVFDDNATIFYDDCFVLRVNTFVCFCPISHIQEDGTRNMVLTISR